MKCPRCQHENRATAKFCEDCAAPLMVESQGRPHASSYAEVTRALSEALEQQTATSEILRAIASSSTNVQPVLDAVAESAARLCEAPDVSIFLQEADRLRVAARHGAIPSDTALPLSRDNGVGAAVLAGETIHVRDMQTEATRFPVSVENAKRLGFRTVLNVPLMREGIAIGAISLRRTDAELFTERQVTLLETFADQAVIAIENVRLFKELQEKNRALTAAHAQVSESLEQQTATSEILSVISSSPTDLQPVFDAIAASATRLCDGVYSVVFRYDGEVISVAADNGRSEETSAVIRSAYPAPPGRRTLAGRAILERRVIAMTNAQDNRENPDGAERARAMGYRAGLSVPMMRGDVAIGVINVVRVEAIPFTHTQIELLKTFADQAVIAIENVRLFKELEERNRELTDSLDRQTSTADILRVISRSPTDIQQVFDTIVRSASRLCAGQWAAAMRFDGELIHLAAQHNIGPAAAEFEDLFPCRPSQGLPLGRAILNRELVHIPDAAEDPEIAPGVVRRARSFLVVPMLREGTPIGAIAVSRPTPGRFPPATSSY
jgi:two-component system, NtrC family, sensor kinase